MEFNINEINVLRGLIYKELDNQPDQYSKQDLISSLEKLNKILVELRFAMEIKPKIDELTMTLEKIHSYLNNHPISPDYLTELAHIRRLIKDDVLLTYVKIKEPFKEFIESDEIERLLGGKYLEQNPIS